MATRKSRIPPEKLQRIHRYLQTLKKILACDGEPNDHTERREGRLKCCLVLPLAVHGARQRKKNRDRAGWIHNHE